MREADLLLHVVDTSNPDYFQHEQTVNQLLEELETSQIQQLTVYNKKDIQHPDFVPSSKNDSIQISTLLDNDREQLKQRMETKIIGMMKDYHVEAPSTEGKLLSQLKNETILRELAFHEEKQLYICKGYTLVDHPIFGQLQKLKMKG